MDRRSIAILHWREIMNNSRIVYCDRAARQEAAGDVSEAKWNRGYAQAVQDAMEELDTQLKAQQALAFSELYDGNTRD